MHAFVAGSIQLIIKLRWIYLLKPLVSTTFTSISRFRVSQRAWIVTLLNTLQPIFRRSLNMVPPHPRPLVFFGPSGSGKSTLVSRMTKEYPDKFGFSVSHTTRNPRLGEVDGKHYHFILKEEMQKAIDEDKFIEYATFGGNMYGTSKAAVKKIIDQGKICILDIDVQGVKKIKGSNLNPWFIFVEPPSIEELEKRLRARNTETEESLSQRLKIAEEEMIYGKTPGNFHIIITNDDLDHAYDKLKAFLVNFVLNDDFSKGVNGDNSLEI